jgi:hypothetical protein
MPGSIGCGPDRFLKILRSVIGEEFASVLARAQRGDEAAFACLWLDVNPALVRYLRVVSGEVDEDVAAETWVTVVRGLARFRGDEMAWRGWVFTTEASCGRRGAPTCQAANCVCLGVGRPDESCRA